VLAQVAEPGGEIAERFADGAAGRFDRALLVGVGAERRRDQDAGHDSGLLFESGAVFAQPPRAQGARRAGGHGDDDVTEVGPRVIEVVLRRFRRMVGMRVIEADELRAACRGMVFRQPVVRRADAEAAARPFGRDVVERPDVDDVGVRVIRGADQRAAAFVRIG